jgi:hypothetical protein
VQDGGLEVGLSGVRVYIDSNGNKTYDVGEPSAITNASGSYNISSLASGTYDVRVDMTTLPQGFGPTYDLTGPLDNEANVVVTAGQTRTDVNFGYSFLPNFSDCYVWLDENGNGVKDAGEPGIPNVRLSMTGTDVRGQSVALDTFTDETGRYNFTNLVPSNSSGYDVTVDTSTLPSGLAANPTYDSNGIGTPNTTNFILNAATDHIITNFGYNWSTTGDGFHWRSSLERREWQWQARPG